MSTPPNDPYRDASGGGTDPSDPYGTAGQQQPGADQGGYGGGSQPGYGGASHPGQGQQGYGSVPQGQPGQGQPYAQPGQAGPGQPWQQPQGAPGQGQQPWGPGGPGTPPGQQFPYQPSAQPPTRSKVPIIIGAVVALVLALAVTGVVLAVRGAGGPDGPGPTASADPEDKAAAAAAAVEGALQGLADGDAAAVLAHIDTDNAFEDLLTDEVLAFSNELATITDIEVTAPSEISEYSSFVDVRASYTLGQTPVRATYSVSDFESSDGSWKVQYFLVDLNLGTGFRGLALQLNGVDVDRSDLTVFPGAYELKTTNENYEVENGSFELTERFGSSTRPAPVLSDSGVEAFRGAVNAAVEECLASTTRDAGCGLEVPETLSDGSEVAEDSLERTIPSNTRANLESLEPRLSYDNPTLVSGGYIGTVDITAEFTQDGRTGRGDLISGPSLASPVVDMADPELPVTWE